MATLRQPEALLLFEKKEEANKAVEKLKSFREKLIEFLKKHGGLFAEGFSEKSWRDNSSGGCRIGSLANTR